MSTGTQIALGVVIAVILFGVVLSMRRRAPRQAEPVTAMLADRVRQLKEVGKPIQAIRELRNNTGMSLREAKEYVDALGAAGEPPAPTSGELPAATLVRVHQLKSEGKTIQAIKLVRAETQWGLKQAKEFVDGI